MKLKVPGALSKLLLLRLKLPFGVGSEPQGGGIPPTMLLYAVSENASGRTTGGLLAGCAVAEASPPVRKTVMPRTAEKMPGTVLRAETLIVFAGLMVGVATAPVPPFEAAEASASAIAWFGHSGSCWAPASA